MFLKSTRFSSSTTSQQTTKSNHDHYQVLSEFPEMLPFNWLLKKSSLFQLKPSNLVFVRQRSFPKVVTSVNFALLTQVVSSAINGYNTVLDLFVTVYLICSEMQIKGYKCMLDSPKHAALP